MTSSAKLIESLHQWIASLRERSWHWAAIDNEQPLRSELFSADQMEQHGNALATQHKLALGRAPDQLLPRLAANEAALIGVCNLLTDAVAAQQRVPPAGEWLLDNFYLIEEQIRTTEKHLPKGYSLGLPRLAQGPSAGLPRVYDIALEIISHGDGRIDTEGLTRFVAAYQSETTLKLGELWAIPIMLRLAVIENLRRVGMRIATGWSKRDLANTWADQMTVTAEKDPKSLILVIADMARSNPPMVSAFVAELARRLQGHGPALALPLTWIEQRLSESGLTIELLIQSENQQQAADQVSISNSIGSLRVIAAMDWKEFVETLSHVEQTLREDPYGIYGRMDFATRDQYRHAAERIAKRGQLAEWEVARKAVELATHSAQDASGAPLDEQARHVGFYLTGKGLNQLETWAQARPSATESLRRILKRHPLCLYLSSIALISGLAYIYFISIAQSFGLHGLLLWSFGMLALIASSQPAVALTNWLATLLLAPRALPRMDFSEGIPPQARTLVVVPTMLTSAQGVEDLIEALEVRFLANRDERLHFGLLTDLLDAPQEVLPEDAPLVRLAEARITGLNEKYGGDLNRGDKFFLFHRARQWNPAEKCWMGFERKRGKLASLNALLRGGESTDPGGGFARVTGDASVLSNVKYVITLDTDTQLPRDTARQFIGAMAHPLNRPRYDATKMRVVEGYGILQPRVAIGLPGANRSRYARLFSGDSGIDPYTRAVSDVYQDAFGEGSFIGKGIYDVDAFEHALAGRFPKNRVLSHDLLEGCYARAGLLSDVQLYEDYPARYSADVSRRHRWIRGDWQLAGWLFRHVPGQRNAGLAGRQGCPHRNPLSSLSQWKLFDNLRRSIVPAALTTLLLLSWTVLPQAAMPTLWVIATLLFPSLCGTLLDLLRKPDDALPIQHLRAVAASLGLRLQQLVLELACLPYEAFFSLDAILRTIWRMQVSRRHLLEWNPSSEVERASTTRDGSSLAASFRAMWFAPTLAASVTLYLAGSHPAVLCVAGPILLLWLASPFATWWISRPLAQRAVSLSLEQTRFLQGIARRTWAFFEHCVGPAGHWLPPDNYQEDRAEILAPRTSPTNMGMALLANLAAYDFGYIPAGQVIERTASTLGTMLGLARFRGHFYNWYDTQTLQPLPPLYVSTVDSGNLAGHLLTLCPGLEGLAEAGIIPAQCLAGLSDTFRLYVESAQGATSGLAIAFSDELDTATRQSAGAALVVGHATLLRLDARAKALLAGIDGNTAPPESIEWAQALARQCREALAELDFLVPWLTPAPAPHGME
ncbi:MAG: beta-(1,2)-glucan production associated transrane protein, partial [Proteobacteria bacterium]|nr:beta-(1,2)-glucan production associated transrane protein [Pseudomonadota bacterium]